MTNANSTEFIIISFYKISFLTNLGLVHNIDPETSEFVANNHHNNIHFI